MPDKNARREATRVFSRLAQNLGSPQRLQRDAGKDEVERFLSDLFPQLDDPEEVRAAQAAVQRWSEATGLELQHPPPASGPQLPVFPRRVCCCDVLLTFNHSFVPEGLAVADWFARPDGGVALVSSFLDAWMLLVPEKRI